VIFGNVLQTSGDAVYFARHIGLKSGVPKEVPALTVNRLCGSGLQAILLGAQEIQLDQAEFVLAGGAENMSMPPPQIRGARWGLPLGEQKLEDYLWVALVDSYNGLGMANTAENLGRKYGITRVAADEFAYRSHMLAAKARESCRFSEEIVPVTVKTKKGEVAVDKDEHIRADTTLEALAKLQARFEKNGTVTPGNASGINDGAAAVVVASAEAAQQAGLKPLARIVSGGVCGVDPDIMGIGPAPSSRQALGRAALKIEDMDLVEINEAFATQYLAVEKDLGLDRSKTNVNGGAIALGHPLGAAGARPGTGLCGWENTQMAPWANDPVRLRDGCGHVFGQRGWRGGTGRRGSKDDPRIQTIQRELTLEPLPAGTRTADLLVGDAVLPLEFESSAVAGVRAVALDVTTSRHGVAVRAVRIARSAEDTAIELA